MDALLRQELSRAHAAALAVPPGMRGHTERAVLAFWNALIYANLEQPFEANDYANEVREEIWALNKETQIARELERVR